jgi:membrane protease YdiL (CAAX protease family)
MTTQERMPGLWSRLPVMLRAILSGLAVGLVAANVWLVLLVSLARMNWGVVPAAVAETIFLALYMWWAGGEGPPRATQAARARAFRRGRLSSRQWFWGVLGAAFFAVTIHASIVLLFRLVPYPMAAFRHGYDLSFIPSRGLRWVVVVFSAMSAGICEETGFRGYMQRPIEERHGATIAILISSVFFMAVHLTKAWATPGMVPIVFGAGVLLGLLAWSAGSLIPAMIGHVLMDIGLFAYWWTGTAGDFTARPIGETGMDGLFLAACGGFAVSLCVVIVAIRKLREERESREGWPTRLAVMDEEA